MESIAKAITCKILRLAKVLKLDRTTFAGNVESVLVRGGDNCLRKAAECSLSLKWLAGSGYGLVGVTVLFVVTWTAESKCPDESYYCMYREHGEDTTQR